MSAEARASWNLPETFTFESQAVRYGSLGEVDRPAIVLLHGTPFSSIVWRPGVLYLPGLVDSDRGRTRSCRYFSWLLRLPS